MGNNSLEIMRAAGSRIGITHISDTMDHNRSQGLRYITNPPGNSVRVHQHLKIGDGDVNWDEFFAGLKEIGYLENPNAIMCSSVFAENEKSTETAVYQRETIEKHIARQG
jgi:myo-inositol catabolism protein IolH